VGPILTTPEPTQGGPQWGIMYHVHRPWETNSFAK